VSSAAFSVPRSRSDSRRTLFPFSVANSCETQCLSPHESLDVRQTCGGPDADRSAEYTGLLRIPGLRLAHETGWDGFASLIIGHAVLGVLIGALSRLSVLEPSRI